VTLKLIYQIKATQGRKAHHNHNRTKLLPPKHHRKL
jgi:hypothetical protein